jgi:predicted SnoaL-like aldol condensation-catalyzing enzyme
MLNPLMGASMSKTLTTNPLGLAAIELLDLAFNQKRVREAFEKHVTPDYIQHNPMVPTGREAAIVGLGAWMQQVPGFRYDFKRVLVDGNFVIVHAHLTNGPGDRGTAVVDILRAENGKFVEHWDVLQPVPENPANQNTMF